MDVIKAKRRDFNTPPQFVKLFSIIYPDHLASAYLLIDTENANCYHQNRLI